MIEFMLGKNDCHAANFALAALITAAAVLTYARLSFEDGPLRLFWPRSVMAVGLTLLSMRFWLSIYLDQNPHVPPLSLIALGTFFGGYCVVQTLSIKRALQIQRVNLRCIRDHDLACAREDRLREAVLKRHH
jgi:hypothetical protein